LKNIKKLWKTEKFKNVFSILSFSFVSRLSDRDKKYLMELSLPHLNKNAYRPAVSAVGKNNEKVRNSLLIYLISD